MMMTRRILMRMVQFPILYGTTAAATLDELTVAGRGFATQRGCICSNTVDVTNRFTVVDQ